MKPRFKKTHGVIERGEVMKAFSFSQRLKKFPPYLFAEIDKKKEQLRKRKVNFIDLSIGDPDIPAPRSVIETLYKAAKIKVNQKYSLDQGKIELRRSIKSWFKRRFEVDLDADKQILPLIGSKEGLVHLPLAFVNKDDYVIVPSPGYPGYKNAARFCEANIYDLPLLERDNFLPDLSGIPLNIRNKAKIMYLNYPNNPTTALAPLDFLKVLVGFCAKYGIILAYDNAYSEVYFEEKPHSVLEVKGAEEVVLEFHSFSKTFCMTGFRLGWACGNEDLLAGLLKVKTNIDSGIFGAIQEAGRRALDNEDKYLDKLRKILKERRDIFVEGLKAAGFQDIYSRSTFYVWAKIPASFKSSIDYAHHLLTKKNIIATPGIGFGKDGEGFIRFALTVDKNKLRRVFSKPLF